MILLIDNYDSFTYNLVQLVGAFHRDITVVRNDKISVAEVAALRPERIIISPGPGRPENAGICVELIKAVGPTIPLLGVCLGHQAIGYAFGAEIIHAPTLMHGKVSLIQHDGSGIFKSLPQGFPATRYHSLVIAEETLPKTLRVTSRTTEGVVMGIRHTEFPLEGIQFHPESILTTSGPSLIANWLAAESS